MDTHDFAKPTRTDLKKITVLIVEDNAYAGLDMVTLVETHNGRAVGPVTAVELALGIVRTIMIDAAVIDFDLADRNSEDLQDALDKKKVPFVIVTAYPRVLVRRDNVHAVLSKPVTTEELCETVMTVCSRGVATA